ncbi:hypothetical protein RB195_002099 [Necator americanus]|uniref:Uncharacterized protein n=1 Tax=Necator americanus TaxID=51031 RepID=A0ABR1DI49_NECAM
MRGSRVSKGIQHDYPSSHYFETHWGIKRVQATFYENAIIDVKRGVQEVESAIDDVHAYHIGLGCPIRAQWNEHIRMHWLRLSGSGIEHDERHDPGQEETSGLVSV